MSRLRVCTDCKKVNCLKGEHFAFALKELKLNLPEDFRGVGCSDVHTQHKICAALADNCSTEALWKFISSNLDRGNVELVASLTKQGF